MYVTPICYCFVIYKWFTRIYIIKQIFVRYSLFCCSKYIATRQQNHQ